MFVKKHKASKVFPEFMPDTGYMHADPRNIKAATRLQAGQCERACEEDDACPGYTVRPDGTCVVGDMAFKLKPERGSTTLRKQRKPANPPSKTEDMAVVMPKMDTAVDNTDAILSSYENWQYVNWPGAVSLPRSSAYSIFEHPKAKNATVEMCKMQCEALSGCVAFHSLVPDKAKLSGTECVMWDTVAMTPTDVPPGDLPPFVNMSGTHSFPSQPFAGTLPIQPGRGYVYFNLRHYPHLAYPDKFPERAFNGTAEIPSAEDTSRPFYLFTGLEVDDSAIKTRIGRGEVDSGATMANTRLQCAAQCDTLGCKSFFVQNPDNGGKYKCHYFDEATTRRMISAPGMLPSNRFQPAPQFPLRVATQWVNAWTGPKAADRWRNEFHVDKQVYESTMPNNKVMVKNDYASL